jgi:phage terminase large subunit-like protein
MTEFPPLSPEGIRQADAAVEFMEMLPQFEGRWAGKTLELMDWQRHYLRELFGRRDPETGLRRYRKAFFFIPKKNGKSVMAAALALKLAIADQEPGAQVYGAAYDKDQAKIIFRHAKGMVEQNPELGAYCKVNNHEARIDIPGTRSFYQALASDARGSHGFNINGLIVDEYHAWKDTEFYDALDNGTVQRDQPLTIIITTAGVFDPESPCFKLYDKAKKVRDKIIDEPDFLPVIYEAPADCDWRDPDMWAIANPSLGTLIPHRALEGKAREAENMPSKRLAFRQLHLNHWPEQLDGWLPMDKWQMCGALEMDEDDLKGKRAWLGIDLASTTDLTAVSINIPLDDGTVATPMRFFCPEDTLKRRSREDGVQYLRWKQEGFIQTCSGDALDYGLVLKEVHRLAERFDVQEIAVDPWNAQDVNAKLMADGFRVTTVPQTTLHMSGPTKELERLVAQCRLRHGNNPVLTWCASNATVYSDGNENIKPDKRRSTERIDGVVAIVTGFARMLKQSHKSKWLISHGGA